MREEEGGGCCCWRWDLKPRDLLLPQHFSRLAYPCSHSVPDSVLLPQQACLERKSEIDVARIAFFAGSASELRK